MDLLPHVPFLLDEVRGQVQALRPDGRLLLTSARTGEGLPDWCTLLTSRLAEKRAKG